MAFEVVICSIEIDPAETVEVDNLDSPESYFLEHFLNVENAVSLENNFAGNLEAAVLEID